VFLLVPDSMEIRSKRETDKSFYSYAITKGDLFESAGTGAWWQDNPTVVRTGTVVRFFSLSLFSMSGLDEFSAHQKSEKYRRPSYEEALRGPEQARLTAVEVKPANLRVNWPEHVSVSAKSVSVYSADSAGRDGSSTLKGNRDFEVRDC
jgi:hypothetical protein